MNIILSIFSLVLENIKTIGFWWVIFGFFAQFFFFLRFIIQWISSEKAGKVVIPVAFWYLSITGGMLLFIYAIYRRDPVFILGQFLAQVIYTRNLVLFYKEKNKNKCQKKQKILTIKRIKEI